MSERARNESSNVGERESPLEVLSARVEARIARMGISFGALVGHLGGGHWGSSLAAETELGRNFRSLTCSVRVFGNGLGAR